IPPAPGQGAIAVQIRRDDAAMVASASAIDDGRTRQAVEAERTFLSASGGGCRSPIGALATMAGDDLDLFGGWVSPDGSGKVVSGRRGPVEDGDQLARELAADFGSRTGLRPTVGHDQTALPR
ncbi:MAG TPA: hypothetical protein VIM20_06275, partial [Candidatus Limnocylindrales bacterium]